MKQFTLKINHKLSGIRESSVSLQQNPGDSRFDDTDSSEASSVVDAIRIKQLNGRIKILEMELQKSREESFKVGFEEGQRSNFKEANKKVEAMHIEIQGMEIKYLETIEQIEAPLLELSKRIAREVLNLELENREDHDKILFERLRKMLYEVVDQNKVIIETNPEHLELLNKSNLAAELNLPSKMEMSFIANKDLQKGEARIQTEDFFIDGSFDEQIAQMHDQLRDKIK